MIALQFTREDWETISATIGIDLEDRQGDMSFDLVDDLYRIKLIIDKALEWQQ